ncbi:SgcJ/EcaC family oxidoreductase [Streptomyces sp. NPDC006458]|uniref:SgcJ/EcaC family oxidoreductase n=1 Tax=Streptomyces sp. NPDC006458 TaxID=3154302 RepID=UPI0033A45382
MPQEQQIRRAVEGYVEAFNKQNREQFSALFAEDAVQRDPVGGEPNRGRAAITGFYDAVFQAMDRVDFRITDLVVTADEAALVFRITAFKRDGGVVHEDGIDTFRVNDEGLITEIKGFHDSAHTRVVEG